MPFEQVSGMYPVWAKTAREFYLKLSRISAGKAQFLAKRMKEYADEFDSWSSGSTPSPEEKLRRSKLIAEYMSCYRDALDVFANKP